MRFLAPILAKLLLLATILLPCDVLATNYYVRVSGDDDNNGRSARTAFATIKKAAEVATNGDTVYIGTGHYTDRVVVASKTGSRTLRFIADIDGRHTGDSGRVVVVGSPFWVIASNNVQLTKMAFRGESAYPVIWQNSYDGILNVCTFVGGEKPVLAKDATLLVHACRLSGFANNAIEVDGGTHLTVDSNTTITGCGGTGIHVRTKARVRLDQVDILDNVGDGIFVDSELASISLDTSDLVDVDLGAPPRPMKQEALEMLEGLDPDNDKYQHYLRLARGDITKSLTDSYWTDDWHVVVGDGPTVYNHSKKAIESLVLIAKDAQDKLDNGGDKGGRDYPERGSPRESYRILRDTLNGLVANISTLRGATEQERNSHPIVQAAAYFNRCQHESLWEHNDFWHPKHSNGHRVFEYAREGVALMVEALLQNKFRNGVTTRVISDRDITQLFARVNDATRSISKMALYDAMDRGATQDDIKDGMDMLFTGDRKYAGGDHVGAIPHYLDCWREALGLGDASGDLTQAEVDRIMDAVKKLLESDRVLAQIAIRESKLVTEYPRAIEEAEHEIAYGQKYEADARWASASGRYKYAWEIAKKAIGNRDVSDSELANALLKPVRPHDWVEVANPDLQLTRSNVNRNANGVIMQNDQHFQADRCHFDDNDQWGVKLRGTWAMEGTWVNDNGIGGVLLTGVQTGNFKYYDVDVKNNGTYGVYLLNCDIKFTGTRGLRDHNYIYGMDISGSDYQWFARGGKLGLNAVQLHGGVKASLRLMDTRLEATTSGFRCDSGYGVMAEGSSLAMKGCVFHDGNVGLYAGKGNTCKLAGTTFRSHNSWGAVVSNQVTPNTDAALVNNGSTSIGFDTCTFDGNGGGLSLVELQNGAFTFQDTVIKDSVQNGLHLVSCNLTLTGAGLTLTNNNYGVSSDQSTLTLDGMVVDSSRTAALHASSSTVVVDRASLAGAKAVHSVGGTMTVKRSKLSGTSGYGVESDNSNFTLTSSQLNSPSGVYTHSGGSFKLDKMRLSSQHNLGIGVWSQSELTATNTVFDGLWAGIVSNVDSATGSATILNVTLANTTGYGVYLFGDGDATLKNTIVDGANGHLGIYKPWQVQLTHSHNIVNGFRTPFSGVAQQESEKLKDPLFKNKRAGDLRLDAGSPAINSGADLGLAVTTDIDGNARPSYDVFEIGAYEYTDRNGSFRILDWQEKR